MNKRTIITIAVIAFIGAILPPTFEGNTDSKIDRELMKTCNEINKNCPVMVDMNTRMDTTTTVNREIKYFFTVIDIPDDVVLESRDKIIENNTMTLKTVPETKRLLDMGVTMTYNYKNVNGEFLFKYSVQGE